MDEQRNDATTDGNIAITPKLEDQLISEIPIISQSENNKDVEIIETEKEPIAINMIDVDITKETGEDVDKKP